MLATVLTDGKVPTAVWLHPRSKTAAFTANLDIVQPPTLEITAYGPLAGLQSAFQITTEEAIAPGQHIRVDGLTAPYVIDGAMEGPSFLAYVEQVLPPTLRKGDIVFMNNLRTHKIAGVAS